MAIAACGGEEIPEAYETPAPTATPTPTPEPTEPPVEPEADEPENNAGASILAGSNWSMEIADGWSSLEIIGMQMLLAPGMGDSHISVHVHSLLGESLEDVVDVLIEMYAEIEDFELIARDYMIFNGKDAVLFAFEAPSMGVRATYQFIIELDGIGYFVTYNKLDEEDHLDDVLSMLDTFTVLDAGIADAQIIGEWHMVASGDPVTAWGLEEGWGYKMHFYDDGTSVELWYSPDSGLHEIARSTWTVSGDLLIMTILEVNLEVFTNYYGDEHAEAMEEMLGIPFLQTFSVEGDNLTLIMGGIVSFYQRSYCGTN